MAKPRRKLDDVSRTIMLGSSFEGLGTIGIIGVFLIILGVASQITSLWIVGIVLLALLTGAILAAQVLKGRQPPPK